MNRALLWTLIGAAVVLGLYSYFAYAPGPIPVRVTP